VKKAVPTSSTPLISNLPSRRPDTLVRLVAPTGKGRCNGFGAKNELRSPDLRCSKSLGASRVPYKVALALRTRLATMARHRARPKAVYGQMSRDGVTTRIANVPTRGTPANGAKPLATLSRNEEFVVFGGEQSGYISVLGSEATGWVKKALLARQ
jgi:hypothetical protein